jgi:hypothetical protein
MPNDVRLGSLRQVRERSTVVFDMEKHKLLDNTDILAGWSIDKIISSILRVKNTKSKETESALQEYHQAVDAANEIGFPYNDDVRSRIHAAYRQLNALLTPDNQLRQILKMQMVEFGGARDD